MTARKSARFPVGECLSDSQSGLHEIPVDEATGIRAASTLSSPVCFATVTWEPGAPNSDSPLFGRGDVRDEESANTLCSVTANRRAGTRKRQSAVRAMASLL